MEIKMPTLVVDLKRVERNIKRMVLKFKQKGVQFRPHFKTHQSHYIGEMYRKAGIDKCTVSSVAMAQYFAEAAWKDITIAFPANVLEAQEMNALAENVQVQILVDSVEKVGLLAAKISREIALFIEVDTGYLRSGILFDKKEEIELIIQAIEAVPHFNFAGFLTHTGNTYSQTSKEELLALFDASRKNMLELKNFFLPSFPEIILSMGDTPAASLVDNFKEIDEMRPGNFVFFDLMQYLLGSCKLDDIATAVYCPVVAKYPERNQVVVYGGGVHLSKEKTSWMGRDIYGFVSIPSKSHFGAVLSTSYVESLSQEHGVIHMPAQEIDKLELGDSLAILTVHSCMTVDLNSEIRSLDGERIPKFRTY